VVEDGRVVGIVTGRDLRFETRLDVPVREIMTPREKLIVVKEGATIDDGKALMHQHKLERVLVVNDAFELRGLMTVKDITKQTSFPNAARDAHGKLRVGAAVGVGEGTEERVELLVRAGVDALLRVRSRAARCARGPISAATFRRLVGLRETTQIQGRSQNSTHHAKRLLGMFG
jgi:IMP dehydrogenase